MRACHEENGQKINTARGQGGKRGEVKEGQLNLSYRGRNPLVNMRPHQERRVREKKRKRSDEPLLRFRGKSDNTTTLKKSCEEFQSRRWLQIRLVVRRKERGAPSEEE